MRNHFHYLISLLLCNVSWGFIVLQRTKASFPMHSTIEPEIVDVLDIMPDFFAMEDTVYQNLQAKTESLISVHQYPLGTLPESVFNDSLLLLNSWARTASPTGASTAASILERLERETDLGNLEIKLSVMHYSIVAHAWAKSNHHQAGWHAEQILLNLDQRSKVYPHLTPNRVVMNCVIHAWSRQGNIERSEAIFHRMKTDPTIDIEVGDYNALLSAYARKGNARKAEGVLKEMLDSNTKPDIISYNCVLESWKQGDETGAAERAEIILETLQKNYDNGESNIRPNGRSYSSVASAYIKSGREDSVAQAERLLSLAELRGLAYDSYLYNSVLDAWAMSSHADAAQKAESILHDMEKAGNVNTVSYNTVIKAWKRSNRKDAAASAEALLDHMENLHRNDYTLNVGPDVYTYTSVIQCYTQTNTPQSASKAVSLFTRMIEACRAGNENLKPNTITLNVVLDALAKTGDPRSAEKAEEILTLFHVSSESCLDNVNLNTVSFTSVIDAYAKSGLPNAAKKAERIFETMEIEYKKGNTEAKPNTRSFNTLMNAWVQTEAKGGVQRAEALLEKMEALYQSGDEDVRPDVVSFSIIMNGWSKSKQKDTLERTSDVFGRMVKAYKAGNGGARPNLHSFVTLLYAIVNSGRPGAPQQAENLLKTMYQEYLNGNQSAKPNTQAITLVMDCWAKSGNREAGQKAESLLNWMIDLYETTRDDSFKPNAVTWNAVVNAWAKSRVFGKAIRAKQVLDRMVNLYEANNDEAKPNTFVYTAVVNAAAYTVGDYKEKQDAFRIAKSTLTALEKSNYGEPNQVTFGAYVTACRNLIPEGKSRFEAVTEVFHKCCQEGMVNDMILQRIHSALSTDELKTLLSHFVTLDGCINSKALPTEWRRNAMDKISLGKSKAWASSM